MVSYHVNFSDIIEYYNLDPRIFNCNTFVSYKLQIKWIKKYLHDVEKIDIHELPIAINR